jgi:hypothetical protein
MGKQATATFQVKGWDENPYDEMDGVAKLTRARVTKSFSGDIEGEGTVEYLMMHREDGTASFVGLERIVGRIGDRSGSFVLRHTGTFEGGTAKATWSVVPGSGTSELRGLRGEGGFASAHAEEYSMTLDYDFE